MKDFSRFCIGTQSTVDETPEFPFNFKIVGDYELLCSCTLVNSGKKEILKAHVTYLYWNNTCRYFNNMPWGRVLSKLKN